MISDFKPRACVPARTRPTRPLSTMADLERTIRDIHFQVRLAQIMLDRAALAATEREAWELWMMEPASEEIH